MDVYDGGEHHDQHPSSTTTRIVSDGTNESMDDNDDQCRPGPDEYQSMDDEEEEEEHEQEEEEYEPVTFLSACSQCDEETVKDILEYTQPTGEQLNARDKTGKSGLSHVCMNGMTSIVSILNREGIDVNLADNEGNTPLIFAAQAGHLEIVGILVHSYQNIKIDKRNEHGFTALMKASVQGRTRCAKLLLSSGASPFRRDYGRRLTSLEWAEYCGRTGCAQTIASFVDTLSQGIDESLAPIEMLKSETTPTSPTSPSTLAETNLRTQTHLMKMVRKKFKGALLNISNETSSAGSNNFSPFQSLEDIARVVASPVFFPFAPRTHQTTGNGLPGILGTPPLGHRLRAVTDPIFKDSFVERHSNNSKNNNNNSGNNNSGAAAVAAPMMVTSPPYNIPKVKVTIFSKDDNYFCEQHFLASERVHQHRRKDSWKVRLKHKVSRKRSL